jgi:hypothetical protein
MILLELALGFGIGLSLGLLGGTGAWMYSELPIER